MKTPKIKGKPLPSAMKKLKVQKKFTGGAIDDYQQLEDQAGAASVGLDIAASTAQYAAMGSAIPVVGTALGAGVGAVMGAGKALLNHNKIDRENAIKVKNNSRRDLQLALNGLKTGGEVKGNSNPSSQTKGGKIKGAGTGTSDSIPADMEAGDFIVPAKHAEAGMKLGVEYLGWSKGQTASKKDGDTPVNVSNGEVRFTKDEADFLRTEMGVNLDRFITKPSKSGNNHSGGNYVHPEDQTGTGSTGSSGGSGTPPPKGGKFSKYAGYAAALAGGLGGIAQTINANRKLDGIKAPSGVGALHAAEAQKIESSADKAIQTAMAEGENAGAEAMGNFMETARSAGGAKASDILKNASMVGKFTGEDRLKRMKEMANLKLGAASEAAKVRTSGATADAQLNAEYDKMKNERYGEARRSGWQAIGDAVTNASMQALSNKKEAEDAYNKETKDRINAKDGGTIKKKFKKISYARK